MTQQESSRTYIIDPLNGLGISGDGLSVNPQIPFETQTLLPQNPQFMVHRQSFEAYNRSTVLHGYGNGFDSDGLPITQSALRIHFTGEVVHLSSL